VTIERFLWQENMPSRKFFIGIAALSLALSACGRHAHVARVPVAPPPSSNVENLPGPVSRDNVGKPTEEPRAEASKQFGKCPCYTEVGTASWYGDPYHGRRAANGEIYDKNKMTAAHLTLPFGSVVKVTDLDNNRTVSVRITDRGPFVKGRIIDLSQAAARELQMVGPGTAMVRLEVTLMPAEPDFGAFAVQVGAFRDRSSAERLRERLGSRYGESFIENYQSQDGIYYRVRLGPKRSLSQAAALAKQVGQEKLGTFVVRVDN
jgi:rare lipoprotein A